VARLADPHRSREGCFKAFRLNHWVGAAVFAGTVLAGWVR
jgi:4-hydroxybenzoate polyprenyltransferase